MWRPLGCADSERFALVWESEELKALNNTLFSFVKNKVRFCKQHSPHCKLSLNSCPWLAECGFEYALFSDSPEVHLMLYKVA